MQRRTSPVAPKWLSITDIIEGTKAWIYLLNERSLKAQAYMWECISWVVCAKGYLIHRHLTHFGNWRRQCLFQDPVLIPEDLLHSLKVTELPNPNAFSQVQKSSVLVALVPVHCHFTELWRNSVILTFGWSSYIFTLKHFAVTFVLFIPCKFTISASFHHGSAKSVLLLILSVLNQLKSSLPA